VRVERIERLANVSSGGEAAGRRSVIALAAAAYAAQPSVDSTTPTGFDPFAVTLFESIVEAAFLVATADGVFDADEREVFARIVAASADNALPRSDLNGLIEELADNLAIHGIDKRIARIAESVRRAEHKVALLRVAYLVALANDTISEPEEAIIARLCSALEVSSSEAAKLRLELTELVYQEAPAVPVE
jgi:tellurite resistance protein